MPEEWTKETPQSPTKKPSRWIWYWDPADEAPCVMELWPKRSLIHKKGWWGSFVDSPLSNPLKGEGIKVKLPPPQIQFKGDGLLATKNDALSDKK